MHQAMPNKTVLISGIGIGGPALAFWLQAAGFKPTLVERAPALRTGGYVIDFWGLGYDLAARMGLLDDINRVGYHMRELRMVDGTGNYLAGFGTGVFNDLTGGRYITLGRSDLSQLIFDSVKTSSEVLFGDEIVGLHNQAACVDVEFKSGARRSFDLVVGADGLHSAVRRLGFGPQDRFEKNLGYSVAAFEVKGYRPRDEEVYVVHGEPGRQLARFALHDDRTLFLFIFAAQPGMPVEGLSLDAQKAILQRQFAADGWESARILDELDDVEELYFDSVSQIIMDRWSRDRIALIGDAAFCISLLGGQGAALAVTSAYVLAGELAKARGFHDAAFANYEALLRSYITAKQRGAERFAGFFAPRTRLGLVVRQYAIKSFRIPGVAKFLIGADIADSLQLPDYGFPSAISAASQIAV